MRKGIDYVDEEEEEEKKEEEKEKITRDMQWWGKLKWGEGEWSEMI